MPTLALLAGLAMPAAVGTSLFVLAMASVILAEEIHPAVGIVVAGLTVAAAGYRYRRSRFTPLPAQPAVQPVAIAT